MKIGPDYLKLVVDGPGVSETLTNKTARTLELAPGEYQLEVLNTETDELVRQGLMEIRADEHRCIDLGVYRNTRPMPPQRRAEATLTGHERGLSGVAFSPIGNRLATTSYDGTTMVWEVNGTDCHIAETLRGHTGEVKEAAFSPDGRLLATCGEDGTVRIWDAATGRERQILTAHEATVLFIAFSPDGSLMASACTDGTVKLWNCATWQQRARILAHSKPVSCVAFSPDGSTLATASDDSTVKLWLVASQEHCRTFYGHTDLLRSVSFSPDGRTLASAGFDCLILLWDVETGQPIGSLRTESLMCSTVFSPGGSILAAADNQVVRFWDWRKREVLDEFHAHWGWIGSTAFSPDGQLLATAGWDYSTKLWTVPPLAPRDRVAEAPSLQPKVSFSSRANSATAPPIAFSPHDENLFALGSQQAKEVTFWGLEERRVLKRIDVRAEYFLSMSIFSDGTLATGVIHEFNNPGVKLWSPGTYEGKGTIDYPRTPSRLAVSPDNRTVAILRWEGFNLPAWVVDTQEEETAFVVPTVADGQQRGTHRSIAFSPDGSLLAVGTQLGFITLWDSATGEQRAAPLSHGESAVWEVAFSPDGSTLASASANSTVKLWDVTSLSAAKELATLKGHTAHVFAAAFSPDGQILVTAGGDGANNIPGYGPNLRHIAEVRLWDVATQRLLVTFEGHTERVLYARFSPDGKTLATSARDGKVYLWDVAELLDYGAQARTDSR